MAAKRWRRYGVWHDGAPKPRGNPLGDPVAIRAKWARRVQGRSLPVRLPRPGGIHRHGNFPLYLLTGDYDFTVPPETTQLIADKVPGAEFTVMTEMGHFCINEIPARFREIGIAASR